MTFGNDWDELLKEEFEKEYYQKLRVFLADEYKNGKVYPEKEDIFTALKLTSYKDTKVVILGQDPYHGEGQAHGLAFSVKPGIDKPPSLVNMFKELKSDLGYEIPESGYLVPWAEQGVLLLNTALTVREGEPNSHKGKGWEEFTDRVISLLNQREKTVIFVLWGKNALAKEELITNMQHMILRAPHPSPLSASRGFFGCKHFSKINALLRACGERTIDWQI